MKQPVLIDSSFVEHHTSFNTLIEVLKMSFAENSTIVPERHHHHFPNPEVKQDSTLLLMPAWNPSADAGVKVVTVSPANGAFDLPSIQGSYLYLDATTGALKAIIEAKSLTAKRTAATSALASSFLSRPEANSLLMIGTGALSSNLIQAHCAVRPIEQVYIWGRDKAKARVVAEKVRSKRIEVNTITTIEAVLSKVDIVSCATLSKTPLVLGKHLSPGQHIDLVGAYKPDMREADDAVMQKASIFLDSHKSGLKESGDIVIPLNQGVIKAEDLRADLFDLCSNKKKGRRSESEITVFKSVGHALEDLVAAKYFYQQYVDKANL
ncbi:MAG: ornithine cyclodeaminase family protein [Allomuricauda sp.]|nr:MAG: ornithine cyclodeaminase family protein [Allomuricauda sp.]